MIRGFKRETELLSIYEKEKVLPLIVSIAAAVVPLAI